MRRADRLFQIVQLLRARPVVTARELAHALEVSLRTVYRDVADLIGSGVPIDGEAGVGYCLQKGFDLPPLMFDRGEIDALVLGARMVQAFGDQRLAAQAGNLLAKVEQVVPKHLHASFDRPELAVPAALCPEVRGAFARVREAVDGRRRLRAHYTDQAGERTERTLRPLCLAFWGMVWTLGAWCELRRAFRTFRVDRLQDIELLDVFDDDPDKQLGAYLALVQQRLRDERGWPDAGRAR
ncbi:MAG: YafY family transcriptional regulator [Planctomycetes bacterium]|nr:YafY family transcriptional regulator [Planctomycetota bacterium]